MVYLPVHTQWLNVSGGFCCYCVEKPFICLVLCFIKFIQLYKSDKNRSTWKVNAWSLLAGQPFSSCHSLKNQSTGCVVAIFHLCFFSHYLYFRLMITTDQGHETAFTHWVGLALQTSMVKPLCCSSIRLFIHITLKNFTTKRLMY